MTKTVASIGIPAMAPLLNAAPDWTAAGEADAVAAADVLLEDRADDEVDDDDVAVVGVASGASNRMPWAPQPA